MIKQIKGYTILEILIVISIIAILAGLIFPVYSTAKLRSKRTICLNNLTQIGSALQMYANDWNGCAPPYTTLPNPTIWISDSDPPIVYDLRPFNNPKGLKQCFAPYGAGKDETWCCPLNTKLGAPKDFPYDVGLQPVFWRPMSIDNPPVISPQEMHRMMKEGINVMVYYIEDDKGAPVYASDMHHDTHGPAYYKIDLRLDGTVTKQEDFDPLAQ